MADATPVAVCAAGVLGALGWLFWALGRRQRRFTAPGPLDVPLPRTTSATVVVLGLSLISVAGVIGLVALVSWLSERSRDAGLWALVVGIPALCLLLFALLVHGDDLFSAGRAQIDLRSLRIRTRDVDFELRLERPFALTQTPVVDPLTGWVWLVCEVEQDGRRLTVHRLLAGGHAVPLESVSAERRGVHLGNAGAAIIERLERAHRRHTG